MYKVFKNIFFNQYENYIKGGEGTGLGFYHISSGYDTSLVFGHFRGVLDTFFRAVKCTGPVQKPILDIQNPKPALCRLLHCLTIQFKLSIWPLLLLQTPIFSSCPYVIHYCHVSSVLKIMKMCKNLLKNMRRGISSKL